MLRVVYEGSPNSDRGTPSADPVAFADGFSFEETEGTEPFRWMQLEGRLTFEARPVARFLEIEVFSPFYDLSQELTVTVAGQTRCLPLVHGWSVISLAIAPETSEARLVANKLEPPEVHPGDDRELAVRLRHPVVHEDASRHAHVSRQRSNAELNLREMLEGKAVLKSTPPQLGIDLYGVCNVKPPCVYCDWDVSKEMEGGHVDTPFTTETLAEWGELFDNAGNLVNCSIGEPFMMKEFDDLLDAFGEGRKTLEMATNGQILTDRNIQKLLGRRIQLYISLDAATPETYAKLRNEKFERILDNLRRLIAAKGGRQGYPRVHLVFMPMRVNAHELEAFVRLCAELQVDRLVLRPLNYIEASHLNWDRGGYKFRYEDELLPFSELVRLSGKAAELCRRHGVILADQLDFGGAMEKAFPEEYQEGRSEAKGSQADAAQADGALANGAGAEEEASATPQAPAAEASAPAAASEEASAPPPSLGEEKLPACWEPWKSLYILRRGVLPCCYGSAPLADMTQYRETWNSPDVQAIRSELAAGRFHAYCLNSSGCPIVRKTEHKASSDPGYRSFLRIRRVWRKVNAATFGVPSLLLRPVKRPLKQLAKTVSGLKG